MLPVAVRPGPVRGLGLLRRFPAPAGRGEHGRVGHDRGLRLGQALAQRGLVRGAAYGGSNQRPRARIPSSITDSRWISRIPIGDHQVSGTVVTLDAANPRSAFHSGCSRRYWLKSRQAAEPPTSGTMNPDPTIRAAAEANGGATYVDRPSQSRPVQRAPTAVHLLIR